MSEEVESVDPTDDVTIPGSMFRDMHAAYTREREVEHEWKAHAQAAEAQALAWQRRSEQFEENERRALARNDDLWVQVEAMRKALEEGAIWHDAQAKALSKQPPGGDRDWRRNEHRDQAEALRAPTVKAEESSVEAVNEVPPEDENDTVCIPGSMFRDMHAAYTREREVEHEWKHRAQAAEARLTEATEIIRPLAIRYDNTEFKPEHGAVQVPTPWGIYAKASAFIAALPAPAEARGSQPAEGQD